MVDDHCYRFLFRCDAGKEFGLGHLARSITVAHALKQYGIHSKFVVHAPDSILERIANAGFLFSKACNDVGKDSPSEWCCGGVAAIVIDSKRADAPYVLECKSYAPVVCFDDENARNSLPCEVIVNNNIWAKGEDYLAWEGQSLFLGPRYNTVAPAYFGLVHNQSRRGVLVSMGGEDPGDHTSWAIRALAERLKDLEVHVCIGPAHAAPEAALRLCQRLLPNAVTHIAPPSLIELASRCHIAITAGGTSCYEFAAAGMASLIVVTEPHQSRLAHAFEECGAGVAVSGNDQAQLLRAFDSISSHETWELLAQRAKQLFSAPGGGVLAKQLLSVLGCVCDDR